MRARKRQSAPAAQSAARFKHLPFRSLAKVAGERQAPAPPLPAPPQPRPDTEEDLFHRAMADVRPLAVNEGGRVPRLRPVPTGKAIVDPEAEALAELSDLVTGVGPFDITNTTEYLEGAVVGLDPRLLRRLRHGEFSYQSHLDLHGMTSPEARVAVDHFLTRAYERGYRCVLIIHGRGLNSKGQNPVLKKQLSSWLSRGAHSRLVLAFTSSRVCDGGVGALYVLLRRERRRGKRPMRVVEGSTS